MSPTIPLESNHPSPSFPFHGESPHREQLIPLPSVPYLSGADSIFVEILHLLCLLCSSSRLSFRSEAGSRCFFVQLPIQGSSSSETPEMICLSQLRRTSISRLQSESLIVCITSGCLSRLLKGSDQLQRLELKTTCVQLSMGSMVGDVAEMEMEMQFKITVIYYDYIFTGLVLL